MTEIISAAPDALMEHTYNTLIPLWLENFARNLPVIREGSDISEIPKRKGEPCILIGAGPSLKRYNHLAMIQKAKWKHPILACDRVLVDCLKHDIKPYVVASVDGSPLVANYYTHHLVRKHAKDINAAFNITIHPNVVKQWKGKVYYFTPMLDQPTKENKKLNTRSVTYILHALSNYKSIISAIGQVGSFLWNLSYALECEPLCVSGDSLLYTNPEGLISVKDVKIGDTVLGQNGYVKILAKLYTGNKPIMQIRTSSRILKATKDHKLFVLKTTPKRYYKLTLSGQDLIRRRAKINKISLRSLERLCGTHIRNWLCGRKGLNENAVIMIFSALGLPVSEVVDVSRDKKGCAKRLLKELIWTPIEQLQKGDLIVVLRKNIFNQCNYSLGIDTAWLAGVFCGDGYSKQSEKTETQEVRHCVAFCVPEQEKHAVRAKLVKILKTHRFKFTLRPITVYCYQKRLYEFISSLGLNKKSIDRNVPKLIWQLPIKEKMAFIAGCIDSDGCIDQGAKLASRSKILIESLRMLCIDVGFKVENIVSVKHKGKIFNGKRWYFDEGILYSFRIQNSAIPLLRNFSEKAKLANITQRYANYKFAIKTWNLRLPQHLAMDIVREIKPAEFADVYDIQVDRGESFFADGVLAHNCLVGYDFSEQVKDKRQAVYFHGFTRMFMRKYNDIKKAMDAAAALHQIEVNPDFGTHYLVNPIWKRYRETLKAHIISSKKHTIQCTGNGCLHTEAIKCPNFEAQPLEVVLKKYA